ncbi:MAG: hypothetical protein KDD53_06450, partial [Bdellovibrionales bacterium]|nr:hypothetical protein [Bdellovibrionales bacterium]
MIATKKLLQYSISFCIGISYIFVITSFAFADDANWLTGQRFLDAKEALEYGRFDEAEKILANLSTKKGLESWVNLYLAEIALEKKQKDKSKSLLGKISPTSAASFYSQYLSMKIDYASGVALSKSRVDSIMKNAKNYGISSIEQNLEFIEILLTQKKGETLEFIKQLQDFRRKNPKSPAALAALRLQRSIVGDPVSATPLLTTLRTSIPEYWATEIQLLLLQGLVNEAADLLKQLRGSNEYFQSLLESDLKLIEAQVALLRASRQMDSYKELLGKLQTNSDPDILQFAWKETAR